MAYRVKNWGEYQQYKDRNPMWIKLHSDLLDDPDYHALPAEQAKYLILIWLAASRHKANGELPAPKKLAYQLHITEEKLMSILAGLSHWIVQNDTEPYRTVQNRIPEERRGEREETETEPPLTPPGGECPEDEANDEPDPGDRENWKALFSFWQQLYNHPSAKFTRQREAKLKARLREGYALEDCASAVRGLKKSRWHMGENPEGRVWDEWSLIFQSGEKLEKFRDLDPQRKLQVVK